MGSFKPLKTKKLGLHAIFIFFFVASIHAQKVERGITLETETGKIEGSLLYHTTLEKVPIVLIISGSGPTDRNGNNTMATNNHLKMLAEGLSKHGIASVRYDKRGVGASRIEGLQESELRFETYVDDASAWIELLKKDDRFSEIIVIGHSEGSLIGMIASRKSEVSKFISLSGTGQKAGDILKEQLQLQSPFIWSESESIIKKLEAGETEEEVPEMLYSLFRPSVQPYLISWFKYNPLEEIAKLTIPILIVHGTTDIQVSVVDAEKLSKANQKSQLHILEGMNHILKEAESDRLQNIQTYSMPELPLKNGLIKVIQEFISSENNLSRN